MVAGKWVASINMLGMVFRPVTVVKQRLSSGTMEYFTSHLYFLGRPSIEPLASVYTK